MPTVPQSNPINLTISIIETKCISFSLTEYALNNKAPISQDRYEFAFAVNLTLLDTLKQVRVLISVKLFEKDDKGGKSQIAELNSSYLFLIHNFDEALQRDPVSGNWIIPREFFQLFNGISISGVRGMYSVKLDDTLYSNAVLPIVDANLLLPNM